MRLGYIVPLLLLLNHIQWIALTHFADLQILLIGKSLRLVNLGVYVGTFLGSSVTRKSRQMSIKVAQKWFH